MANNLNYITFDQMMASVESDLSKFADSGMINRGTCIKVARKVNSDLGLSINREKETVVHIENYVADLPEDFLFLQLALICKEPKSYNLPAGTVWGTHTQEKEVPVGCNTEVKACLNSEGGHYWVTQIYKEKTVKIDRLMPIRLSRRSLKFCADNCINNNFSGAYEMDIQDGQIVTNFREGDVYLNYLCDMVDEDNNILILDHPLVTPYYEYSIKKHLMENFFLNGSADVERRLGYIRQAHSEARIAAINFTNTIEYTEIQDIFKANRVRFHNKYVKMFDSWS